MRRTILSVLFGVWGLSMACAEKDEDKAMKTVSSVPKITREYLLAHGFKELASDPGVFTREHVRLSDVSRDLGFSLASLRPEVNQAADSDERTADAHGVYIIVRSEVRESKGLGMGKGHVVRQPLDNPNAICTVHVSLKQAPPAPVYLKTDSSPRMHIKCVVMPEDRLKPLRITFELAATGKKPLAVLQRHFWVELMNKGSNRGFTTYVSFPKQTPKVIIILPGKPMTFTVDLGPNGVPEDFFRSGAFDLRIVISAMKFHEQTVDYEWEGTGHSSDKYKLIIK